jgi:hypothetical protein
MSVQVLVHNVAALLTTRRLSPAGTGAQTAGATSAVTGVTINRVGGFGGTLPRSAEIAYLFDTTLAHNDTLTITPVVQDSADGATWATYYAPGILPVATGNAGGTAQQGQVAFGVDLGAAREYIRVNYTLTFSASSVDTTTGLVTGAFAGFDRLAAPN